MFLYNLPSFTNNNSVSEVFIYITAVGFLIAIFPIHVFNYIYINTEQKYASINVTIFRYIRIYNINTVKDKINEMQVNGKSKNVSLETIKFNFYKIFNKLCIQKIIQLTDFGIMEQKNAYAAIAQYGFTTAIYNFLKLNGNSVKLRNYLVMNEEHSAIRYYAKAVTVINLFVIIKIIIAILMEKLNEHKN